MFRLLTLVTFALSTSVLAGCPGHPSTTDADVPPPTAADEVVLLPFPADGGAVTWEGWAGGFVRDYCVECHNPAAKCGGEGCHASGDPILFDFRDKAAVLKHSIAIECGVGATTNSSPACAGFTAKEFPKWTGENPLPTDEQRALFVAWMDAGSP